MSFDAELVALLRAGSGVDAAFGDAAANEVRIYPGIRPTGQKNLPALVYTVIGGGPLVNLDFGDSIDTVSGDVDNVRLQVDVYAKTHDAARAAARLVQAALAAGNASIRATRLARQSVIDPDTREHREILDYSVWHFPQ